MPFPPQFIVNKILRSTINLTRSHFWSERFEEFAEEINGFRAVPVALRKFNPCPAVGDLDRSATLDHTLSMLASLRGREVVPFIALCVLLLFFFPLAQGPFQATHGPTTAFRARMVFLILIFAIFHGALGIFDLFNKSMRARAVSGTVWNPMPSNDMAFPQSVTLRC